MGQTIIEKILSAHSTHKLVSGEVGICCVDFCFSQDGTTALVLDGLNQFKNVKNPKKYAMFIDHSAPSPSMGVSKVHSRMREFTRINKNLFLT
jgi:3-isopropylmalate/(R)-2-methylmalate dehydratase large subunit